MELLSIYGSHDLSCHTWRPGVFCDDEAAGVGVLTVIDDYDILKKNMKTVKALIKTTGLFLLVIFVLQVGGLTCANDIYEISPSSAQGQIVIKAADLESKANSASYGDLLYECHCPCHLNFSPIETVAVSTYWITESSLLHLSKFYIPILSREILQPPKI